MQATMIKFIKDWSGVVALVILAIMGGLYLMGKSSTQFGSTSCANITCLSGGLRLVADAGGDFESDVAAVFNSTFKLGTNGTSVSRLDTGKCYFQPSGTTITASSSTLVDCQGTAMVSTTAGSALPGVTAADNVVLALATSTTCDAGNGGLIAQSASASSTAGYITVRLFNACGTTFTWPTSGTASGTASYIVTK